MKLYIGVASFFLLICGVSNTKSFYRDYGVQDKEPIQGNILICVNVVDTDSECTLPYFLKTLEDLKCPGKCSLRFNFMNTSSAIIQKVLDWANKIPQLYANIIFYSNNNYLLKDVNVMEYIQRSPVSYAIENGYDYLFVIRGDYIMINKNTLYDIIKKKKTIVAPLFGFPFKTYVANFGTEETSEDKISNFEEVANRIRRGCFAVETVFHCYLINLNEIDPIKFQIDDTKDSLSCDVKCIRSNGFQLFVCNRELYGYRPQYTDETSNLRCHIFKHLLLEYQLSGDNQTYLTALNRSEFYKYEAEEKTTLGFDKVYVINLKRRVDRRNRIQSALEILNLQATINDAYDGLNLTEKSIKQLGIQFLPDYYDPYNKRVMNFGEVACFLSHYEIWLDAQKNNYSSILVLEDDARFSALFTVTLQTTLEVMQQQNITWDMLYLGRKIMEKGEKFLHGFSNIAIPLYSHWTVAYILSEVGVNKLLSQDPLKKLLPVDEYFPIMYDQQPNKIWSSYFEPRNLKCYAFQPVIVQPTHYYGEPNYISDTEDTKTIMIADDDILRQSHVLTSGNEL